MASVEGKSMTYSTLFWAEKGFMRDNLSVAFQTVTLKVDTVFNFERFLTTYVESRMADMLQAVFYSLKFNIHNYNTNLRPRKLASKYLSAGKNLPAEI